MAEQTRAIQKSQSQDVEVKKGSEREWHYCPTVDIIEKQDEFMITADVPGASKDTIDVTYQEDVLTIDAPVAPRGQANTQLHRQEYGVGRFHRRFVVEAPVNADNMSAAYAEGVLTVHLPKAEEARGRRIEVKSG